MNTGSIIKWVLIAGGVYLAYKWMESAGYFGALTNQGVLPAGTTDQTGTGTGTQTGTVNEQLPATATTTTPTAILTTMPQSQTPAQAAQEAVSSVMTQALQDAIRAAAGDPSSNVFMDANGNLAPERWAYYYNQLAGGAQAPDPDSMGYPDHETPVSLSDWWAHLAAFYSGKASGVSGLGVVTGNPLADALGAWGAGSGPSRFGRGWQGNYVM